LPLPLRRLGAQNDNSLIEYIVRNLIDGASLLWERTLQLLRSQELTDKLGDGMERGTASVPRGLASRA
jgi:hypothetical protein